jgi:adenine-specific DNA methylase
MIWDFVEINPLAHSGGWTGAYEDIATVIETNKVINEIGQAEQCSATNHILADDCVSALITDPPYYDSIPYADLSDFFYVWIRQIMKFSLPQLTKESLTPKEEEAIWNPSRKLQNGLPKDKAFYELQMSKALLEGRRITKPDGISVVVFAHKSTSGWEALLQALVSTGWRITASWAIDTERASRTNAIGTASLASSVHLVCRPRENSDGSLQTDTVGEWSKVLQELPKRIHEWLPRLRDEGIVGADAIFACLGPALEIFSRYERVEKSSGEVVPLRDYLESVWAAVSKEALQMIFTGADASGFEPDARLTAMWLWTLSTAQSGTDLESRVINALNPNEEADDDDEETSGKAKTAGFSLEFDTARKIAQGMGINLEELRGTVEIKGELARLLAVKERSNILFGNAGESVVTKQATRKKSLQQSLFAEMEAETETSVGGWHFADESRKGDTVLDRLHQAMLFFAANRSEALKRFLVEDGVGQDERFWRLANALSALYPTNSEEKRWVDGILARKKGLGF